MSARDTRTYRHMVRGIKMGNSLVALPARQRIDCYPPIQPVRGVCASCHGYTRFVYTPDPEADLGISSILCDGVNLVWPM